MAVLSVLRDKVIEPLLAGANNKDFDDLAEIQSKTATAEAATSCSSGCALEIRSIRDPPIARYWDC